MSSRNVLVTGFGLVTIAQFIFSSVLAIHLSHLDVRPGLIGIFMLVFHVALRGMGPLTGPLVDSLGTRRVYGLAFVLATAGYVGASLVQSPGLLLLSLGFLGLGLGLDHVTRSSLMVQISKTKEEGNRALALGYVVFNLAAAIGPLVSSAAMLGGLPLPSLFAISGVLHASTGIAFYLFFPFPGPKKVEVTRLNFQSLRGAWANESFRGLFFRLPFVWFLFSVMHAVVPVFLLQWVKINPVTIASMFSLNAVLVVLLGYRVNVSLSEWLERRGYTKIVGIALGSLVMGVGILLLLAVPLSGAAAVYAFMFFFTLGELAFVPMIQGLVNDLIPHTSPSGGNASAYFGIANLAAGIGAGLSNFLGGYLIELCPQIGYPVLPVVLAILSLGATHMYWRLEQSPQTARQPALR